MRPEGRLARTLPRRLVVSWRATARRATMQLAAARTSAGGGGRGVVNSFEKEEASGWSTQDRVRPSFLWFPRLDHTHALASVACSLPRARQPANNSTALAARLQQMRAAVCTRE